MNGSRSMITTSSTNMLIEDCFNRKFACMKVFAKRDDILGSHCSTPFFATVLHQHLTGPYLLCYLEFTCVTSQQNHLSSHVSHYLNTVSPLRYPVDAPTLYKHITSHSLPLFSLFNILFIVNITL